MKKFLFIFLIIFIQSFQSIQLSTRNKEYVQQFIYETPVISNEKKEIKFDPQIVKEQQDEDVKYNKMMQFLSKLQMESTVEQNQKQQTVFDQIKIYLNLMKQTQQEAENRQAKNLGKPEPNQQNELNSLEGKIKQMSMVIDEIENKKTKYVESQKELERTNNPRDDLKTNSQIFSKESDLSPNNSQINQVEQLNKDRKEKHNQEQKDIRQYLIDDASDQDDLAKKAQHRIDTLINNITGEGDYPLIPREHIQDNIEKSVEINDIKTPDNIEELLMNDLKILDQYDDKKSNHHEQNDNDHKDESDSDDEKKSYKNLDDSDTDDEKKSEKSSKSRFQEANDEDGVDAAQELVKFLIKKLKSYATANEDLEDSLEFSKKFIKKKDYQTALNIISAVE